MKAFSTGNALGVSWAGHTFTAGKNTVSVTFGATGGVPEPTTWALMIAGFGLAGASLRHS